MPMSLREYFNFPKTFSHYYANLAIIKEGGKILPKWYT